VERQIFGFIRLKDLFFQIRDFVRLDFRTGSYLYTAVFLATCCTLNYHFDLDDVFLEPLTGTFTGLVWYFLFYGVAYYGVSIPVLLLTGNGQKLNEPLFWICSFAFTLFISLDAIMQIPENWINQLDLENSSYWARRTLRNWAHLIIWIPGFWVFLKLVQPSFSDGLYGIRWKAEDIKPYLAMLWIMVPLIAAASFLPDFQNQYPVFKRIITFLPGQSHLQKWVALVAFEVSYVFSFISTELMFRGGLALGMAAILGRNAILPMVSVYMFLHFGKPMGESISSVFGGYILGILALQNRNIWGGIFIHGCIAFLMDLAAAFQLRTLLFHDF